MAIGKLGSIRRGRSTGVLSSAGTPQRPARPRAGLHTGPHDRRPRWMGRPEDEELDDDDEDDAEDEEYELEEDVVEEDDYEDDEEDVAPYRARRG